MRASRAAAALTAAAALLAAAGCGVPPSGVIQAGDAATGLAPGISVYFLTGKGLLAVPRGGAGTGGVAVALRLLFAGPGATEGMLGTALPRLPGPPEVEVGDGMVSVVLPDGVGPLSRTGMAQVVCTVAGALALQKAWAVRVTPPPPGGGPSGMPVPTVPAVNVLVAGTDWKMTQPADPCPLAED